MERYDSPIGYMDSDTEGEYVHIEEYNKLLQRISELEADLKELKEAVREHKIIKWGSHKVDGKQMFRDIFLQEDYNLYKSLDKLEGK